MKINKSRMFVALLLVGLFFMMPTNAMAKGIFDHQATIVPINQTVDDVVVIGGDATVYGTVKDSVIVVNGDVDLKSSANIKGFVFVIGGHVKQEQGAVIKEEIISLSFDNATINSLLIGGGVVVGTWLLQLALSVLFVILPVLTVFLSKGRINRFVDRVRQSPSHLLYIGLFSSLILSALTVLLLITIVGIPVALFIFLFVGLSFIYGLAVISMLVGERIQGIWGQSDWLIALRGSIVLVSFMNIPFIGGLLTLGIQVFSIGIMILWILEKLRRKSTV